MWLIMRLYTLQAEALLMASKADKEYLPITGLPEFTKLAAKLAYGAESRPLIENRVCFPSFFTSYSINFIECLPIQIAVTQSISGTGALRVGGAFIARHYPHPDKKIIYLPKPSWGNHTPIFRDSGLEVRGYRYFDKDTVGLDFEGLKADLKVRTP